MPKPTKTRVRRRQPQQRRARVTVDAILDAVARVLAREGVAGVTTNRIAARAGVSIGSVYQYFPDKRAIFVALRDRHVAQMSRLLDSRLVAESAADLQTLLGGLIEAMIEAHAIDPAVHALTLSQIPRGPDDDDPGFQAHLRGALRLAIGARSAEFARPPDIERLLFGLSQMLEALVHGVVLRRPAALSLAAAREEAVRAVLAYLQAHGHSPAAVRGKARKRSV